MSQATTDAAKAAHITPTIGRRVWYWPRKTGAAGILMPDELVLIRHDQPFDAGIVFVHNEGLVNLSVTDHRGKQQAVPNVSLLQSDDPAPICGGYCEWMPFQQGQAKQQAAPGVDYADAYQGAREDLAIWKKRALEAEAKLRPGSLVALPVVEARSYTDGASAVGAAPLPPESPAQQDIKIKYVKPPRQTLHCCFDVAVSAAEGGYFLADHVHAALVEIVNRSAMRDGTMEEGRVYSHSSNYGRVQVTVDHSRTWVHHEPEGRADRSDGLAFGEALAGLKSGSRVTRAGWNGKGMWLEMQRPDGGSKMTLPYLYLNYPSGSAAYPEGARVPWAPSQTDMLAEDWTLLDAIGEPRSQCGCGPSDACSNCPTRA